MVARFKVSLAHHLGFLKFKINSLSCLQNSQQLHSLIFNLISYLCNPKESIIVEFCSLRLRYAGEKKQWRFELAAHKRAEIHLLALHYQRRPF